MKKRYILLFLSLALLTLTACNRNNSANSKPKESAVSTKSEKKADKKKTSTAKSSEISQASSSQPAQTQEPAQVEQPAQNTLQIQDPGANTTVPNQANQAPQVPVVEQPVQQPAPANEQTPAVNNWMSPEQRANYIEAGQFDPNFIDHLSQADYQLAVDRAQQRLEETGYGDVSLIWYELYKMNPESTTLFDTPPYDSYAE